MSDDTFSPVQDNTHSPIYPPRDPETGKFVPVGDHMNPISEAEMKEFFSRLATNFVDASRQAQELKSLQAQVHDLITKIEGLVTDNTNLRNEVNSTYEFVRELEQENTKLKQELQTAHERNDAQVMRIDGLHKEIERLDLEVDNYIKVNRDSVTEIANLRTANDSVRAELANARYDSDYWKNQYHTINNLREDVEKDNRSLRNELDRYKRAFDAMTKVLEPPQDAEFRPFAING